MNSNQNPAEMRAEIQAVAIRVHAWQCCLNCLNWNGDTANANGLAGCGKFQAMPPPGIIVTGCRDYENDIPF